MTISKTLLLAIAGLAVAACATTTPRTKVASTTTATRTDAVQAAPAPTVTGLYSQSWVKDEDAKDKKGPDGIAYR